MCAASLTTGSYDKPSLANVKKAAMNIRSHAYFTPVLTCEAINRVAGHQLFFKCENLQKTGSFKFRGAINAISHLSPEVRKKGIVTHSSGNHAQAIALASRVFDTTAHIVMPSNSSQVKKDGVRGYGARITECEPTLRDRVNTAEAIRIQIGGTIIPPFDHPHIISGQGTCALEFLKQVPNLDVVMAPVGGGGLISGICVTVKGISRRIQIIAGEPAGADDAFRSKEKGELISMENPQTIADGLRTSLGKHTWPFVKGSVDQIITVTDEEIVAAMKLIWERMKVIVEPSSAVPLAALLNPKMPKYTHPMNIGIIVSGGNVDLAKLPF